jgi:hypothetical protein
MDSEEMRIELESFVNAGLQEGWRGWPLKDPIRLGRAAGGQYDYAALRIWPGHRDDLTVLIRRRQTFPSLS